VATLQELSHLGVGFVSLTAALDLTTPIGRARAGLLAVFAEFEHEILRERVRAGLAHARQRPAARPTGNGSAQAAAGAETVCQRHQPGRDRTPVPSRAHLGATHVGDRKGVGMSEKQRSFLTAPARPTKDRKQVPPDPKVPLELNDRERELILKHTFADDERTARLRIVPGPGEPPVFRFTLDDGDELAGYVAAEANHAEANHAKDKKLQKELLRLYARMAAVLESDTDENDGSTDCPTTKASPQCRNRERTAFERSESGTKPSSTLRGPEEQALGWYYYLENKLRFPLQAKCIASLVMSPRRKGETVEVRRLASEEAVRATCSCSSAGRAALWRLPCRN
jgi:hypothetical protein